MRNLLFSWIIAVLLLAQGATAQTIPFPFFKKLIASEVHNDYKVTTTVNEKYRPQEDRVFELKYILAPEENFHVVTASHISPAQMRHLVIEKDGKKFVKFYIHPDSEKLYEPLIKKYGFAGHVLVSPTSSTRTVFAWDPAEDPPQPMFLKVSLAQQQDNLGRIIPAWEVRRSVNITSLIQETPQDVWLASGASVIPEVGGVYVDKKWALSFKVDENQPDVQQHGYILRDASYLDNFKDLEVVPMFSIFSARGKEEPLAIELWKKSGKSFPDFLNDYLFEPFMKMNSYLLFEQGIIPEFHAQNVLLALDPITHEIKHFIHRDIGSMKVDLRLRWIKGLDIDPLRTPFAAYDFKFQRSQEFVAKYLDSYLAAIFNDSHYGPFLKKYVSGYDATEIHNRIFKTAWVRLQQALPTSEPAPKGMVMADYYLKYYSEHPPQEVHALDGVRVPSKQVWDYVNDRSENENLLTLPESWAEKIELSKGYLITRYGIVYRSKGGSLNLSYFSTPDLQELKPKTKYITAKPEDARDKYEDAVKRWLKEYGLTSEDQLAQSARDEVAMARLRNSDAFSDAHKQESIRFVIERFKKHTMGDDAFVKIANDHTTVFAQDPSFKKIVAAAFADGSDNSEFLKKLNSVFTATTIGAQTKAPVTTTDRAEIDRRIKQVQSLYSDREEIRPRLAGLTPSEILDSYGILALYPELKDFAPGLSQKLREHEPAASAAVRQALVTRDKFSGLFTDEQRNELYGEIFPDSATVTEAAEKLKARPSTGGKSSGDEIKDLFDFSSARFEFSDKQQAQFLLGISDAQTAWTFFLKQIAGRSDHGLSLIQAISDSAKDNPSRLFFVCRRAAVVAGTSDPAALADFSRQWLVDKITADEWGVILASSPMPNLNGLVGSMSKGKLALFPKELKPAAWRIVFAAKAAQWGWTDMDSVKASLDNFANTYLSQPPSRQPYVPRLADQMMGVVLNGADAAFRDKIQEVINSRADAYPGFWRNLTDKTSRNGQKFLETVHRRSIFKAFRNSCALKMKAV